MLFVFFLAVFFFDLFFAPLFCPRLLPSAALLRTSTESLVGTIRDTYCVFRVVSILVLSGEHHGRHQ
jgi:hypothetical protein